MIDGHRGVVLRQVGALFRAGSFAGMSDGQLLEHFLARGGGRRGAGVLRPGRAARADGPPRLPGGARRPPRRRGRLPGHVPRPGPRRAGSDPPGAATRSPAGQLHGRGPAGLDACARSAGARRRKLYEGPVRARGWPTPAATATPTTSPGSSTRGGRARLPRAGPAGRWRCATLGGLTLDEPARAAPGLGPVGTVKSRVARGGRGRHSATGWPGAGSPRRQLGLAPTTRGASAAVRPRGSSMPRPAQRRGRARRRPGRGSRAPWRRQSKPWSDPSRGGFSCDASGR